MNKREFITLLGGAATWPLAASAQQADRARRIGVLLPGDENDPVMKPRVPAFTQALADLGWIDGRNVRMDVRWGGADINRIRALAQELVGLQPDIILTSGTVATAAFQRERRTIPIVFVSVGDPVASGIVPRLNQPGGNITGFGFLDIAGKRAELLRDVVPGLRRLAIMANVGNPLAVLEMSEAQTAARKLGLEAITSGIRGGEDIVPAFDAFRGQVQALYVCGDPLVATNVNRINTLALGARLPTMQSTREFVQAGGLMSYAPNFPDLYRRAAELVDKILRGAKPSDIPVEQPTKFELVVNLIAAKAIGLTVPPTLLALADEVIE
jgi:putative ABC transport system substrate-binding protein